MGKITKEEIDAEFKIRITKMNREELEKYALKSFNENGEVKARLEMEIETLKEKLDLTERLAKWYIRRRIEIEENDKSYGHDIYG